jgi:hypothetical protein
MTNSENTITEKSGVYAIDEYLRNNGKLSKEFELSAMAVKPVKETEKAVCFKYTSRDGQEYEHLWIAKANLLLLNNLAVAYKSFLEKENRFAIIQIFHNF